MNAKKEEPKDSLQLSGKNKKRRVWNDSTRPKRRKTGPVGRKASAEDEEHTRPGSNNAQSALPHFPRIPIKSLVEVETKLVYDDEQDIIHQLSKSLASSASQLMCQASEIVGPPSGPNLSFLPQIDKWLVVALQDADSYYRQKKYVIAARLFTTALELCTKGAVVGEPFDADYEYISTVSSFIEAKLVVCYLGMKRPDLALNHSSRSIHLNPIHFLNHLRQAMVYRLLGQPCAASRSAMIADYVYWLSGGTEQHISKLIKLYWQAMLEDAIATEDNFSVMYIPCSEDPTVQRIEKTEEIFREQHPTYALYLFTDSGDHLLPQTTDWSKPFSQKYTLTLGFRRHWDGCFLEKLLTRKCPTFTGIGAPFTPASKEDIERQSETLRRRILPVLDFIRCTKLVAGFSPGSGLLEKLQCASYLDQLWRTKERSLMIHQALAELAVAPYLQDISQSDAQLLQALMADIMDTLEGRQTDKERVWNEMQKVGMMEDLVYKLEGNYLRNKAQQVLKKEKAMAKRQKKKEPPFDL